MKRFLSYLGFIACIATVFYLGIFYGGIHAPFSEKIGEATYNDYLNLNHVEKVTYVSGILEGINRGFGIATSNVGVIKFKVTAADIVLWLDKNYGTYEHMGFLFKDFRIVDAVSVYFDVHQGAAEVGMAIQGKRSTEKAPGMNTL